MTIEETNKLATKIALATFALGTFCFVLFALIPGSNKVLMFCTIVLIAAILANGLTILLLFYNYSTNPFDRQEILVRIFLMLCNIPIAALYFFILIKYFINKPF